VEFSRDAVQQELYERIVAAWRDRPAAPDASEFPRDEWDACGRLGLLGLAVPRQYGGLGADCATTAYALEALGYACADAGLVFAACAHLLAAVMPIVEMGGERLKAACLPDLASGRSVGAGAMTEIGAGSDVFAMSTTAIRDGDGYRLNGEKAFITNAPIADVMVVYAVTNPNHGYWRSSAFVVDGSQPGVSRGAAVRKIGLHSATVGCLRFDDCYVPGDRLIGKEGQGAAVFERAMRWERSCLFAAWIGLMQRQLERCVEVAKGTKRFARPIGKNQGVAFRLADMKLRLEASRLLVYRACWHVDTGDATRLDSSLAKLAVSEAAIQSSLDAIQIHGARGIVEETGIACQLRDMVPGAIYSGTSEMQRDIICAELGL